MTKNNNGKKSKIPKRQKNRSSNKSDLATVAETSVRRFTPMCYGFPDRLVSTLRYHTTNTISSVSGSTSQYGFRWNSIFDPDYTSAGHQPLYHDTYGAIYDHYSVVSARAIVTMVSAGAAISFVNVVTDDDATPSTTGDTLAEQSHGMSTLLGINSSGSNEHIFRVSWDCKKVLGIDPYTSQTYKTAFGTNPAEQSFLWLTSIATGGGTADVVINVLMEFDCLFTELATPIQS